MQSKDRNLTGKFRLVDGREVFGTLRINGETTKAELFDQTEFPISDGDSHINGELHHGGLVTLLQCILKSKSRRMTDSKRMEHSMTVFPHYVAIGSSHVSQSEPCISSLSFAMEDAKALFYDFDAFSTVIDAKPFVPLLQNDMAKHRQIEFGEHPIIGYFTGKIDIAVVKTALGEVRAHHGVF